MEDTRTTAARTHFDCWSETYKSDSAARWLREVQTQALAALVCTTAFHHFPRPRDTIQEMARVLAPGGRVVIADANRRHPAVFALDLVLRVAQPSHARFRSPAQLMHDLCATGFHRVSYCTIRWRSYAFVRAERIAR